jgi:5-methylcytosine-specific restriction endonuclease McrA
VSRNTPHLCAEPYCTTILPDGPGRCPEHRGAPRSGTPGYGANWRRIRDAYIAEFPQCEFPGCTKPAVDVHHIDGRHPSEPRANDWTNLESLCRSHHRRITEHVKRKQVCAT